MPCACPRLDARDCAEYRYGPRPGELAPTEVDPIDYIDPCECACHDPDPDADGPGDPADW